MPAGTVLFSSRAPIGYISIADGEVTTNQGFKSVAPNNNVGTAFVYYFHTRKGQHKLLSNASQVGVPALARASTTFQEIEIEVPSVIDQERIVGILEAIREKEEINNAINENLAA